MAATKIVTAPDMGRGVGAQAGVKPPEALSFSQPPGMSDIIMVWEDNLETEITGMRDVAETYDHVALETQFPGIVARPTGPFSDYADYNYQTLKANVDLTTVLQISLTFSDEKGNRPKPATWRFNFSFNAERDLFPQDSLEMRGLDLNAHSSQGIKPSDFAELLMGSGLVLNEDIRWVTFGSPSSLSERSAEDKSWLSFSSMYDLGYLWHLLTSQQMPSEILGFQESLDLFFPSRCDISKHLHRLGLAPHKNGEGLDLRTRQLLRQAHYLLESFFRLPESIRRNAFERDEEHLPVVVEDNPRQQRRRRDRDDERRHKGSAEKCRSNAA